MTDQVEQVAREWTDRRPDLDPGPMLIVGRIQRLTALWDMQLRRPFADAGLCSGDFDVLAALRRLDSPATPTQLADGMLVTAGAITKRIDRLITAGLATRTVSPDDGRSRLVQITAEGVELADRLIEMHLRNEKALISCLSKDEQESLRGTLERLLQDAENRDDG
jgi:DNA-binding MarR family transcriptional regulator